MRIPKKTFILICVCLAAVLIAVPVLVVALLPNNSPVHVIVIGKVSTLNVEFWHSVRDGMDSAAEDLKVTYEFRSTEDESDVEGQIKLLEQAAAERPDVIVWIASDYGMTEQAEMLAEKKIKFVMMDSDVNYTGEYKKSFIGTDNYNAARTLGERIGNGDYGRKAAVVTHSLFAKTGADRTSGFRDGFLSKQGNEFLEVYDCSNSTAEAERQTRKLLDEHPDTQVVLATNEVVTLGVAKVVLERGLQDSIEIFAFDCSKKQIQYLENGTLRTIVAQYPFRMAYLAVASAVKVARGEKVDPFVDSGMVQIDANNLYDKENQEILFPFK